MKRFCKIIFYNWEIENIIGKLKILIQKVRGK